jgi:septum formation protein
MKPGRLVLASASPRRRELLARAGVNFVVLPADVDERPRPGEAPEAYVERVAHDKAAAAARLSPDAWILAADTAVLLHGEILGKPDDDDQARDMLRRLAGRTHLVTTAICLCAPGGAVARRWATTTEVDLRSLGGAEIDAYVTTGEWRGKAGAYAIQGIAAAFVSGIRGSYTNVVGLPLCEVLLALAECGAPGANLAQASPV